MIPTNFSTNMGKGCAINYGFKNHYCPVCWYMGRLKPSMPGVSRFLWTWLCDDCADYLKERGE